MNIITSITQRCIEARGTNKGYPCNVYASEANAEKAVAAAALRMAQYFSSRATKDQEPSADYVVVYIKEWDRWVGAINQTELLRRPGIRGGYLGTEIGFFCW